MGTEDEIVINLASDTSEGENARRKLQEIDAQVKELRQSFEAGNVGLDRYNKELGNLAREAGRAQKALDSLADAQIKSGQARLTGADRASAKAQLGLASANILQDAVQGGPASTINNFLGLAGNGKVKALAGEFLDAAGGASGLATALGSVALVAGAAFLAIDGGLKAAKLDWSDFDDVIGNLAPIRATSEAVVGLGEILKETGLTSYIDGAWDATTGLVGTIADATLGWGAATVAAKAHKDEVERATQAARDYAAASKRLASIKSDDQVAKAKRGKEVGEELANLGGGGGLDSVIDKLAGLRTAKGGDEKIKVTVVEVKDGKEKVSEVEMTRRDAEKRNVASEIDKANQGDEAALGRLRGRLAGAGYDLSRVDASASGRDLDQEEKDKKAAGKKAEAEARRQAEKDDRDFDHRTAELTKPLQDRFNVAGAKDDDFGADRVEEELRRGGMTDEAAEKYAESVYNKLDEAFREKIGQIAGEKGLDTEGAKAAIVKDADKGLDHERGAMLNRARQNAEAEQRDRRDTAERAMAGTGVHDQVKTAWMREYFSTGDKARSDEVTARSLAKELQQGGQSIDDAIRTAREMVSEESNKLMDDAVHDAMTGGGVEIKSPERIAVSDFARSIEADGAQYQKKTNDILGNMKDQLAELIRQGPNVGRFGR